MEIFGVGSPELFFFLFLAGLLLGPRRIVGLVRDVKKTVGQVQGIAKSIGEELNREIDLMEVLEGNASSKPQTEDGALEKVESLEGEEGIKEGQDVEGQDNEETLPEAYQKFREDFPEESILDGDPPEEETDSNEQPNQGSQPNSASVRSNALAGARKQETGTPKQVIPDSLDS